MPKSLNLYENIVLYDGEVEVFITNFKFSCQGIKTETNKPRGVIIRNFGAEGHLKLFLKSKYREIVSLKL